jgi:hypothetical protein
LIARLDHPFAGVLTAPFKCTCRASPHAWGAGQGMGFPTTMVACVTRGQEELITFPIYVPDVPDLLALPWSSCHDSASFFYTFLGSGTCLLAVNGFPPISINATCARRSRDLR